MAPFVLIALNPSDATFKANLAEAEGLFDRCEFDPIPFVTKYGIDDQITINNSPSDYKFDDKAAQTHLNPSTIINPFGLSPDVGGQSAQSLKSSAALVA